MKLIIDTEAQTLTAVEGGSQSQQALYTRSAYEAISREWIRVGWSLRCYGNFTWFGHPILQLPEDMVRVQEVVYRLQPDVMIETGVYQGGSMMFYASLCQALGKGRVIGIDREIPVAVRQAIERHFLAPRITLIEGDSVSPGVLGRVAELVLPGEAILVILDSCHTREHVLRELEHYSRFVTPGSYIIAADGIIRDLADVPGGQAEWVSDNPLAAAGEFVQAHPEFEQATPSRPFQETNLAEVTYWPGGWLKRLR